MSNFIKNWSNSYDFESGWGLLIGYNNNIYFPSRSNIIKINLDGTKNNSSWASSTQGLDDTQSMVIDGNDMYVSNYQSGKIIKINLTNSTSSIFKESLAGPVGLVIYNGYIYVCCYVSNKISKISLTNPTTDSNLSWMSSNITNPTSFAIYNDFLYVCNSAEITKINLIGTPSNTTFIESSVLSGPTGLAIYNEYIYVSNYNSNKISKFSLNNPTINPELNWLTGLENPSGLTIYNDNMYISNFADGGKPANTFISRINMNPASCLLKGTKVRTKIRSLNCHKKIEDIKVGDDLISHLKAPVKVIKTNNWKLKWSENISKENKVYVLENNDTKTFLSAYHRFMQNNKMIYACNANLRLARKEEICDENDEYELYHIQVEDHTKHNLLVNNDIIVESWDGHFD
jgi:hypothetical protein